MRRRSPPATACPFWSPDGGCARKPCPDAYRRLSGCPGAWGNPQLPVVPASAAPPHVTLTVDPVRFSGGPVMEASVAGIAALDDTDLLEQAAAEAGDLERCVAWAWLSHTPQ